MKSPEIWIEGADEPKNDVTGSGGRPGPRPLSRLAGEDDFGRDRSMRNLLYWNTAGKKDGIILMVQDGRGTLHRDGSGLRLLLRLHVEKPGIPLLTGGELDDTDSESSEGSFQSIPVTV